MAQRRNPTTFWASPVAEARRRDQPRVTSGFAQAIVRWSFDQARASTRRRCANGSACRAFPSPRPCPGFRPRVSSRSSRSAAQRLADPPSDARENMFLRRALEAATARSRAAPTSMARRAALKRNLCGPSAPPCGRRSAGASTSSISSFTTLAALRARLSPRESAAVESRGSASTGCGGSSPRRGAGGDARRARSDPRGLEKRDGEGAASAMERHLDAVMASSSPLAASSRALRRRTGGRPVSAA